MNEITEHEFLEYERVRESGVTNMFAVSVVSAITQISKQKIMEIIKNYKELKQKYLK